MAEHLECSLLEMAMYGYLAALVLSLAWTGTAGALDSASSGHLDGEWFAAFDWRTEPGVYAVPGANASFRLNRDEVALFGEEAGRFIVALQGAESFRKADCVILSTRGRLAGSMIIMSHVRTGFVRDDDWDELNRDALLEAIRESTVTDNAERIANGHPPMELLGWSQPPAFDRQKKVVYWALEGRSERGEVVNAAALRLSRDGFTKITWVGEPQQFRNARSALHPAISRYDYDDGWRYGDYRAGDVMARIGLAALTHEVATGRTGRAVASTATALAKQLWFLLFVPLAALWHILGRRSR